VAVGNLARITDDTVHFNADRFARVTYIPFTVANTSSVAKVEYNSPAMNTIDFDDIATLTDNFGNTYKHITKPLLDDSPGDRVSLYPGNSRGSVKSCVNSWVGILRSHFTRLSFCLSTASPPAD
jgi:hypothetical protein